MHEHNRFMLIIRAQKTTMKTLPSPVTCLAFLGVLSLNILLPAVADQLHSRGNICFPPYTGDEMNYLQTIRERFGRNIQENAAISHDIGIKFFVMPNGIIRDASLINPSNTAADLACLDAVYCASPLPPAPLLREGLPPPPWGKFEWPSNFGYGIREFYPRNELVDRRLAREPDLKTDREYDFHRIPLETLYRYPGAFTRSELDSSANLRHVDLKTMNGQKLETLRYQWVTFYVDHPQATKEQIADWAKEIDLLLEMKKPLYP